MVQKEIAFTPLIKPNLRNEEVLQCVLTKPDFLTVFNSPWISGYRLCWEVFLALERSVYYSITCGINLLNQFNETLACEPLYRYESKTEIVVQHKNGINK